MKLQNGTRIGSYEILSAIGAGGMGEVYRARDTRLERDVAIKVLPEKFAENRDALARFEREAKAVASLAHPNILSIYDFGEFDGVPYAVMELLEGQTLREQLHEGPLPPRKAATLAQQIADGLGAAHDRGIVHRDLKPENIFVTTDGRAKVLDFGLAADQGPVTDETLATLGTTLTDPGTVLGTVGYMAPEQVRGEKVDHRSDIFAFGCVLYEMLGGNRAFRRDTPAETMTAVLREEPDPLESVSGTISPALDRVVRRCLEKNPEERFQSTRDLAFAIDNSLSDSAARVSDSGAVDIPAAPRRIRFFGWPLAIVTLIVGAVAGALLFPRGIGTPVLPEPPRVHPLTVSGYDSDPAASPDGRMVAFRSLRDGTPRIWLKQLIGGGEEPLTDGPDAHPRFSPDGSTLLFIREERDVLSVYRQALVGGQARKLVEDATVADWSPDGERIAFVRTHGREGQRSASIGIADARGGHEKIMFEAERSISALTWFPDGKSLLGVEFSVTGNNPDCGLLVLDVDSGEARHVDPTGEGLPLSGPSWSADGKLLLGVAGTLLGDQGDPSSRFALYDFEAGKLETLFWGLYMFPIQGMRTSTTIADIVKPGTIVYHETIGRQRLRQIDLTQRRDEGVQLTRTEGRDRQPVYSPDGRRVMFSSNRSGNLDLWVMDLESRHLKQLTDDAAQDWDPGFSQDGRQIIWSSDRGGHLEIWIANVDGSGARQLSNDGADAENPTFTEDGRWVVYWSSNPEKLGIWKIKPDGSDATQLLSGAFLQPEVSPDGKYASYLFQEQDELRMYINVLEVETGNVLPFRIGVPLPTSAVNVIYGRSRWLPNGSGIAYVGLDEHNRSGIYAQDFVPGKDTSDTRRPIAGFSRSYMTESFGISPDGKRLILATLEESSNLMLVDGVPDVRPAR